MSNSCFISLEKSYWVAKCKRSKMFGNHCHIWPVYSFFPSIHSPHCTSCPFKISIKSCHSYLNAMMASYFLQKIKLSLALDILCPSVTTLLGPYLDFSYFLLFHVLAYSYSASVHTPRYSFQYLNPALHPKTLGQRTEKCRQIGRRQNLTDL